MAKHLPDMQRYLVFQQVAVDVQSELTAVNVQSEWADGARDGDNCPFV